MIQRTACYARFGTREQIEPGPLQEPKGVTTRRIFCTSREMVSSCELSVTGPLTDTREKSLACNYGANTAVHTPKVRERAHDYLDGVEISYATPLTIPLQKKWPTSRLEHQTSGLIQWPLVMRQLKIFR